VMKAADYASWSPEDVRKIIRTGEWSLPTPGMCKGYAQANLVMLPKELAFDFLVLPRGIRNPAPFSTSRSPETPSRSSSLREPT
jgi:uncharacterized protein YcsI (UPF0317 family)